MYTSTCSELLYTSVNHFESLKKKDISEKGTIINKLHLAKTLPQ